MKNTRGMVLVVFLLLGCAPLARAFFPFSVGKQELKTDYSQTVWDRIMLEQSVSDMRRGLGEMSYAKYQDAANSFAKAVIKNPQDPMPHLLYGASLYWSGKVDDAMSEYREALRLDPQNAMGYQLLGIAWGWKADIAKAQENFKKAAVINPHKADTQMNLGSTYAVQKNFDKALDHYRKAVDLAPREALYHYQLGTLYDFMGRDAQAETSYKKALRLFYRYEDAQLALASLYEKRENHEAALKYYKKAVKTKPGDYVARLRYAYLLTRLGQAPQARDVMQEAFSIVQFKSDGLALNAVYRASGRDGDAFKKQIEKFKRSLLQVPPAKDINVDVSLDYRPAARPQPQGGEQSRFAEAYQSMRGEPAGVGDSAVSFRRSFVLNAADETQRAAQVEQFVGELERAVTAGTDRYDVNMSLQGRTMDYASPSALTQQNAVAPKAAYDPRIVGNDMGLWVMGKSWVRYVDEIIYDLREQAARAGAQPQYRMLLGLAYLLSGDAARAAEVFQNAHEANGQDDMALLGLGTAAVMAADDAAAQDYYQKALRLQPGNKTAKRNLKVLAQDGEEK